MQSTTVNVPDTCPVYRVQSTTVNVPGTCPVYRVQSTTVNVTDTCPVYRVQSSTVNVPGTRPVCIRVFITSAGSLQCALLISTSYFKLRIASSDSRNPNSITTACNRSVIRHVQCHPLYFMFFRCIRCMCGVHTYIATVLTYQIKPEIQRTVIRYAPRYKNLHCFRMKCNNDT